MTQTEKPLDIHSYISLVLRQKWWIIIPLVASAFVSFGI